MAQSNGVAEIAFQSFKMLYVKKELDREPCDGACALWRNNPQEQGQLLSAWLWFVRPIRHPQGFSSEMTSNPDTLEEARKNFCKRQKGYRRQDDPDNIYNHPVVTWTLRPGSLVLMCKRRRARVKVDQAMVLTVSPSDCSCRVQRESNNHTFLLNRSKLVSDQAFADDEVIDGGCNFP